MACAIAQNTDLSASKLSDLPTVSGIQICKTISRLNDNVLATHLRTYDLRWKRQPAKSYTIVAHNLDMSPLR